MDLPASLLERTDVALVALLVVLELDDPVLDVALGRWQLAMRAAMPEAPIDEDGHLLARPRDVRPPRDLPLQAISSKPRLAQALAHEQLRLRVLAFVGLHDLGRGLRACRRRFRYPRHDLDLSYYQTAQLL